MNYVVKMSPAPTTMAMKRPDPWIIIDYWYVGPHPKALYAE